MAIDRSFSYYNSRFGSQELQFVEDVVLVYGGWADGGPLVEPGSMTSLESFKLRQVTWTAGPWAKVWLIAIHGHHEAYFPAITTKKC